MMALAIAVCVSWALLGLCIWHLLLALEESRSLKDMWHRRYRDVLDQKTGHNGHPRAP